MKNEILTVINEQFNKRIEAEKQVVINLAAEYVYSCNEADEMKVINSDELISVKNEYSVFDFLNDENAYYCHSDLEGFLNLFHTGERFTTYTRRFGWTFQTFYHRIEDKASQLAYTIYGDTLKYVVENHIDLLIQRYGEQDADDLYDDLDEEYCGETMGIEYKLMQTAETMDLNELYERGKELYANMIRSALYLIDTKRGTSEEITTGLLINEDNFEEVMKPYCDKYRGRLISDDYPVMYSALMTDGELVAQYRASYADWMEEDDEHYPYYFDVAESEERVLFERIVSK